MNIKSKFDTGQEVYIIWPPHIQKCKIHTITITRSTLSTSNKDKYEVALCTGGFSGCVEVDEDYIFATQFEAINHCIELMQKEIVELETAGVFNYVKMLSTGIRHD